MEIAAQYSPENIEQKWYKHWIANQLFESKVDEREPYTIVIPPPNVTGVLHMGHMLNNTIQDVLIRRARLQGKNACWVPGTDHASIATEAKVVARLKEQGIEKSSLSRDEFLKHAWDWTDEYGGVILKQLRRLGASCDWSRTKFTMDSDLYDSVIKVFVDLYDKGLIYRGYRMVNWDPEAQTTLSDEEVIYKEMQGSLYYLSYRFLEGEGEITIATTRPETIFGDVAICVNPEDERYRSLIGKKVRVPICNREIPIIADSYVDPEFGTGCLKITPAHDINDKNIGDKYDLDIYDVFNADGTLNAHAMHYQGRDRFEVRDSIAEELKGLGLLIKKESHLNNVGTSERTGAVIEPRLSDQWFLKMEKLVKPALTSVLEDHSIQLYPKKFENTYRHWLENIRDWNISRQLWWGQQIPAYYYGDGQMVVAISIEEAVEKANQLAKQNGESTTYTVKDFTQDVDVLDTWFSSWLWPISVFNGILDPENEEINYYYPTQDLVTGPDILFFWVARMIIAGYEYRDAPPFTSVYLTGLVRDKQGRKMSKSLGNSPDALGLIDTYGADAVRVGLLLSSAAGNDLLFDESLCDQGRSFANKIWNAFRLIKSFEVADIEQPVYAKQGIDWFEASFAAALEQIEDHYEKYRISDVLMSIYRLIWDDFCSWLLEIIKPAYGSPIDQTTLNQVVDILDRLLVTLHPFMPFLTEELWQSLKLRDSKDSICVASMPKANAYNQETLMAFETSKEVVSAIRSIRKEKSIAFKESLELLVTDAIDFELYAEVATKLANTSLPQRVEQAPSACASFRVSKTEFFIPLSEGVDLEAEREKIQKEIDYLKGFLASVDKKLSNERFVSNAPEKVIELERKKAADAREKIEGLEKSLGLLE
jgi:valyl-tRNA synthetase